MIQQQRKTNALLRARAQTVSPSLAPARTRTRLVQQQQHHALRWQPSEERDPADHRAQPGKVKYAETGFSDTVPTRLTKCGRLDSNWHWNPCSYPSSPESLPRLDLSTTRRPCRGRLSFGEKSSRSFKVERLGGAHAHRTQLQQAQIRDDADAQIAVCEQQCGAGRRATPGRRKLHHQGLFGAQHAAHGACMLSPTRRV